MEFVLTQHYEQHRLSREDGGWYIDLPEYLEQGDSKGDLEMISGADAHVGYCCS